MQYQYEITRLDPKHEYVQVKYSSDGRDDFYYANQMSEFTPEAIEKFIETGGGKAVDFWKRVSNHPETVDIPLSGTKESTGFSVPTFAEVPHYNQFTHYAVHSEEPDENNVFQWEIKEKTQAAKERDIRFYRDELLSKTDWMVLSDSPEPSQEWLDYRQALRDIPSQTGFPDNVIWPEEPTSN